MKQKIKKLIAEHKERLVDVFEQSNELSNIKPSKLKTEEQVLIKESLMALSIEYDLRSSLIHELENLL
jgi:hypothetical protein